MSNYHHRLCNFVCEYEPGLGMPSTPYYNLIHNFSIIACGARHTRSCATAYLLTGAQHTLGAGIVRVDRELFHQIIIQENKKRIPLSADSQQPQQPPNETEK